MKKLPFETQPPIDLTDTAIVQQFIEAMEQVAEIMTQADKQGISCGFSGITKKPNAKFQVDGIYANKKLIP